jgi:hypothetical protein
MWQVAWWDATESNVRIWPRPDTAVGTPREWADRVVKRLPAGTSYAVIDDSVALPDRIFRRAYRIISDKVEIDMPTARTMQMGRIRVVRNQELERESGSRHRQPLEIEALFPDERNTRLQTLRDIPQTFDLESFTIPETLKAAWPAELPPE